MPKSQGKTAKQKNSTSAEAANEEGEPKSKKPCNQGPSSSCAEETPEPESQSGTGLKNSLHGNIFQLKLLMLFLIRGIRLKYFNFELTTEGEGGKFDDLVFLYQDAPQSEYRYRYLQAKHRQSDDNKITKTDLLDEADGDFSLQKYFRSYRKEIANRGRNVQDCIICTNVGFDQRVLESNDFNLTLIDSNDEILAMEPEPHFGVPARYKFQQTEKLVELFRASSELHQLAKKLLEYANTSKKMTLNVEIFKIYHVALRKEKVIDKNKFHRHFIEQNNLSQNISEFREIIFKLWSKDNRPNNAGHSQFAEFLKTSTFNCSKKFGISNEVSNKTLDDNVADEEITEFLDKLVFAVNMPNEVRLGHILTKEVGQHFNVRGCDFQSSYILEKLLDWFKEKKSNPILKGAKDKTTTGGRNLFEETRQKMVALRATAFSIDFRANYLPSFFRESFQYHEETITEKAEELEEFLNSPEENKTLQISTKSLRCTTVKILSALDTLPRFKDSDDGYLLIESEHLERNKHMKEWVQGAMNEDKSHQVLVVIGETPVQVGSYEKELMPKDTQLRKKMIFICSDGLATQFEELFDSMENSDVIFKIGGRPFPAHKLILVTRCQVFATMFKHETKEKLSNEIEIEDVEPDVFHQLLRFIYTGRLSLETMETMAVALFIAADKYLLDQLKDKCELFLLYKMTPVNCLELLLQADFPNLAKLKEEAAVYFRRHQERVMATDKWQIVEQECPSLLGDIQEYILAKIS